MLAPSTLQSLEALFEREGDHVSFSPGQQLLEQGQIGPGVWWITKGCVRSLAALPPKNDWRTVQRHGPGELVGWLGLIHARAMEWLRASEASTASSCCSSWPMAILGAPVNSINGASSVMSSNGRWIRTPHPGSAAGGTGWMAAAGPIGPTLNRFNNA